MVEGERVICVFVFVWVGRDDGIRDGGELDIYVYVHIHTGVRCVEVRCVEVGCVGTVAFRSVTKPNNKKTKKKNAHTIRNKSEKKQKNKNKKKE